MSFWGRLFTWQSAAEQQRMAQEQIAQMQNRRAMYEATRQQLNKKVEMAEIEVQWAMNKLTSARQKLAGAERNLQDFLRYGKP